MSGAWRLSYEPGAGTSRELTSFVPVAILDSARYAIYHEARGATLGVRKDDFREIRATLASRCPAAGIGEVGFSSIADLVTRSNRGCP